MENNPKNDLVLNREKFRSGELDKFQYAECLNHQHRALFDYPAFLAGTDVAEIRITAEGVSVRSVAHDITMMVDTVDLHATPYALLDFGSYETVETAFMKSVFREGDVFFDIGANIGWYSMVLGRNCPDAQVYAFEPIPSTVEVLKRNISLNRLNNVKSICLGMYSKVDVLDFLYAPDVSGATSLKLVGQARGEQAVCKVACEVTTLDAFCASHGVTPTLLKVDVEGSELMVVQGGEHILAQAPIILMELLRKWSRAFDYHPNDVLDLLGGYGYGAWVFNESGKIEPCARITEDTVQTNFVFMHPFKHAGTIQRWR
ncbi:FkbM family methyltransferase [Pseudomonas putida]|uniref:FkbM family methyltransferase n=1 Tax=Pseudomonas putida TaxID=303 RepID=UPI0018D8C8A2|nr:FkbM family methyltransferase [Pseudomonas putida]MBH3471857.1 FkbM family methyltransferase [Pseudomonas putida]